jgi:hypothetical protein
MSYSSFVMWGALTLMAFGAFGGAIYEGNLIGIFEEAYPSELDKKDALHRCGQAEASFSRFSGSDRETCYRALLTPRPM